VQEGDVGFGPYRTNRRGGYSIKSADYKHSGCSEAAKMRFPTDHAARKEFKHWCKNQWKIYKKEHP
jgi:hypothetical protein